ncbi:MAG TPA: SDR family NAD(P)-dependent oxidoreductase [Anaerolineae bacterium]|nr:SDR family NAD(P)-dependent oxidoreductase [Anaerolineae bacterium]
MQPRVVIVTGASTGIGAATAELFGRKGWAVVLAARSQDKLQKLAADMTAAGSKALAVPTDVTVKSDIEALVQKTLAEFGRIDVLINNAGVGISGTLETVDLEKLEYVFALNVFAPLALLQAVAPTMKAQHDGVIVNVSSIVESTPIIYTAGYGASKAALSYLSQSAAIELAAYGIDVIKVVPGNTESDFESNKLAAGQFVSKDALLAKTGAFKPVKAEVAAQSIWDAVMKRRLVTYVTAQDRFLCMAAHLSPVISVNLSKLAIRRYVPLEGAPAQATIGQDLAKFGALLAGLGALLSVGLGWLITRRRGNQNRRGQ